MSRSARGTGSAVTRGMTAQKVPSSALESASVLGLGRVSSGTLQGLDFQHVHVEVSSRRGPSFFQLAGLAEAAVRESRIRVESSLAHLGISLNEYALTASLAPADLRKSGSGLDLALAVAITTATKHLELPPEEDAALYLGELSLDGRVKPISGILPLMMGAKSFGFARAYVARENAEEAMNVRGLEIFPVDRLDQLIEHLKRTTLLSSCPPYRAQRASEAAHPDFSEVRGQNAVKRALLIAASGHHHALFIGPPGSGKSMLCRRLPGIMPPLDADTALTTTAIFSIAGLLRASDGVITQPPFRSPHHTVSDVGLIGGGSLPRPGELSLAHGGVIFLDELPEFRRTALEALREPLETGEVHIARAKARVVFPARPLLLGAMNPCPCGYFGDAKTPCRCSVEARRRYRARISGPLLDRIDLCIQVPRAPIDSWPSRSGDTKETSTEELRAQVQAARAIQEKRRASLEVSASTNSRLSLTELERVAEPDEAGALLLRSAVDRLGLSARAYVRTLRVSRTIADIEGAERVQSKHLAEALSYRVFDAA